MVAKRCNMLYLLDDDRFLGDSYRLLHAITISTYMGSGRNVFFQKIGECRVHMGARYIFLYIYISISLYYRRLAGLHNI